MQPVGPIQPLLQAAWPQFRPRGLLGAAPAGADGGHLERSERPSTITLLKLMGALTQEFKAPVL